MNRWRGGGAAIVLIMGVVSPAWSFDEHQNRHNLETQILYRDENAGAIRKSPLPYNNEGIEPAEGLNFYLRARLFKAFDPMEITLEPLIEVNEKSAEIHGYLRYKGNTLNVDLGQQSLWWGPGVHGSLFLTNNAHPLPMLRVFNPDYYRGGPFRTFPLHFDIFISRLEKDRFIPEPYFQGTRMAFQPHPQFRIGFNRMIIMGGEGRPGITPARYGEIWFGENKEGDAENANSIAGIDVQATFPGVRLYGEYGGEDEAGYFPSHEAYLAGASFQNGGGENRFTIEYADITDPAWYVHSLYQSGYTYKGRILGHHVGGAAHDLYLEQTLGRAGVRYGKVMLDYEKNMRGASPVTVYQMGTEVVLQMGDALIPWTIQTDLWHAWVCDGVPSAGCRSETTLISVSLAREF